MELDTKMYKVVIVKHPNCAVPYTFEVPENMKLKVGDYVLVETKKHPVPQVAQCTTPDFEIRGLHLVSMYGIQPKNLRPVVGYMQTVMVPVERKVE